LSDLGDSSCFPVRDTALLHLWWSLAQWFVPLDGLQLQSLGVPIIKRYSKNCLRTFAAAREGQPDFLLLGREHGFVVAGADSTSDADDVAASGNDAAAEGAAHAD
jgi:hypothetical protein